MHILLKTLSQRLKREEETKNRFSLLLVKLRQIEYSNNNTLSYPFYLTNYAFRNKKLHRRLH